MMIKRRMWSICLCLLLFTALLPGMGYAADAKFSIAASAVTASADDGNVPANTVDGNLATRWSASGDNQWIQYDLGSSKKVAYVKIAFQSGDTRTFNFDIKTSADGTTFTTAKSNVTSAMNNSLQTFDFPDVSGARYVRIIGHMNSASAWNSYTEVEIYGEDLTGSNIVNVSTSAQLVTALNNATAGTEIVLANGTYYNSNNTESPVVAGRFVISGKNGTSSQPITIRAANQGQAVLSGSFLVKSSSYIVIKGLKLTSTALTPGISLNASNNIRLTNNLFKLQQSDPNTLVKWVELTGANSHHNMIDHNEFGPRNGIGQMISVDGAGTQVSQNDTIEYNYFHDWSYITDNGGENIRVGLSGMSMSDGLAKVQYNLFENTDNDDEVISVKSSHNTIRYNTVKNSRGQITARHGHANSYYGNFILGDGVKAKVGGFRIYGNDHKIYNNYMSGLTMDAVNVDSGDYDGGSDGYSTNPTKDDLTKHWKVYRAEIVNNTIVNSTSGINVGMKTRTPNYAPQDVKIANNLMVGINATPMYNVGTAVNPIFQNNIGFGQSASNFNATSAQVKNADPNLVDVNEGMTSSPLMLKKLSSASTQAINASGGTFTYVTEDMDGEARSGISDIGADEYYASSSDVRKPLTVSDVGPVTP
ncbi:hypothetical protein GCM10023310_23210 [Paenibacillus vulneris]